MYPATELNYYGNVCCMYCSCCYTVHTDLVSPKVSVWAGANGHMLTLPTSTLYGIVYTTYIAHALIQ